jgi:hypothetical protein
MIPIKDKKYMLNCQGPYDYNRYAGDEKETLHFGPFGLEDVPVTLTDIYIPYKIGCGLGGADWSIVQEIIHKTFEKSENDVYICKHE